MQDLISPPPLPGDQVGPYLLGEMLGVGGMATVYRATWADGPDVAVKILHPGKAESEEERRFRREFLTLQQLEHNNVVRVFEAGRKGSYPWISMELVEGTDLGTLIDRWNAHPPPDRWAAVTQLFRGLCAGLGYVHAKGLIHRDIKPSNVLVTEALEPKVTDFGVVKAPGGAFTTQLTVAGRLVGTVAFMAPECITGDPVDARADLYSLGAVLYMMLTGKRPIQADSIAGYLARHLTAKPTPPSEHDPRVPRKLERICLKLLQKESAQRYANAQQVIADLDADEAHEQAPVHGRDGIFAQLLARLASLQGGAGGVVGLLGPSGIGRSSVLSAFVTRGRAAGIDIAHAPADAPDVFAALFADLPKTEGAPGGRVAQVAHATAGRPWVLAVDDLHLRDAQTLADLTQLLREQVAIQGEPLLLVGVGQGTEGPAGNLLSGVATGLSGDQIHLPGLDRRSAVALVRDRGLSGSPAAALGHRLFDELEGHPGAIVEQLDALEKAGWLVRDADGALKPSRSVDELREARLPVPARMLAETAAQLSGLPTETVSVLQVLAVLGVAATGDLVADIAELGVAKVWPALQGMIDEGRVRRQVGGGQEVVSLSSERERALIYGLIDGDRRGALHRRAADALQARSRRRSGPMAEIIAGHLLHGGELARAYPLLLVAAQRNLRAGRSAEARRLLRHALDARGAAETRLDMAEGLRCRRLLHSLEGELLQRRGDLTGALTAWNHALKAAQDEGNGPATARARAAVGLVQAARGESAQAVGVLEAAVATLPQGDPLWPRAADALATGRLMGGDRAGAQALWDQIIELGEATGNIVAVAEARAGLGLVALVEGRLAEGQEQLEGTEYALRDGGRPLVVVRTLLVLGELALRDGRMVEAGERAIEAERLARDATRITDTIRAAGLAAETHAAVGTMNEARRVARDAAALVRARPRPRTALELMSVLGLARALVDAGCAEDARAILPPDLPEPSPGLADVAGMLLAVRARVDLRYDPPRAAQLAEEALSRTPSMLAWHAARLDLDVAQVLEEVGNAKAEFAVRRALGRMEGQSLRLLQLEGNLLAARMGLPGGFAREAQILRAEIFSELGDQTAFITRWV